MTPEKAIKNYRDGCEGIARVFTKEYFPEENYGKDTHWVGDEIGGILCISDFFFGMDRMVEAFQLNATTEQLIDYYYRESEAATKPRVNFAHYVKWGLGR